MARNSIGALLRRFFFLIDAPLALLLAFTITMFVLILVIPLLTVFLGPSVKVSLEVLEGFRRYPYLAWPPLGEWVVVSDRGDYKLVIVRLKDLGVIPNTLIVASTVTLLTTIVGVFMASIVARYDFPGRGLFRALAVIPLLYTPFVNAFVLYKVFGDGGILGQAMLSLGLGYSLELTHLAGVIVAQTLMFWPIVYLNTLASILQVDPSLEEQAENMGARGLRLFTSVTLPLSLPGVLAGSGLVFLFSMEDLAAPLAFKVNNVVSIRIVSSIIGARDIELLSVEVAILAGALLLVALTWLMVIRTYLSLRHYAMIVRGGRWQPRVFKPSPLMYALIYLVAAPLLLISISPQVGVLTYAFSKSWLGVLPSGFTLDNFQYIFRDDMVVRALRNSVMYSAIALALIVFMGVASAYFVNRVRVVGVSLLDFLVMSPLVIPGLSIAMGLLLLYSSGPLKGTLIDPFSNPMILIILAYAIRKSPFTTRAVYAGLQQVHQALEEAGMNLGASRTRVLLGIVVPLIGLNVLAGALISFVYCMTEVSVSVVLGALKPDQAPITYVIFDYLTAGYGGGAYVHVAAAIVALILFVQIVAIFTTNYILKYRYAFLGL